MKLEVRPGMRPRDVEALARVLRVADREELAASSGRSPLQALVRARSLSAASWTVFVRNQPEAMFGVAGKGADGCVWLLGSPWLASRAARRPLIELGSRYVETIQRMYPRLYNYVDARNTRSINWLLRLGFGAADIVPEYGVGKLPFVLMVRDSCVNPSRS